jgi:hypothetical protein
MSEEHDEMSLMSDQAKWFAGALLSIVEGENLDRDEIIATLESWEKGDKWITPEQLNNAH